MDKKFLISFFILHLIVPNLINANAQIYGENNPREYTLFLQDSVNNYNSLDHSFQLNNLSTLW